MRPRTDLGTSLGISLIYKVTKSTIETNSKVYKPKTYYEAIDDLILGNK